MLGHRQLLRRIGAIACGLLLISLLSAAKQDTGPPPAPAGFALGGPGGGQLGWLVGQPALRSIGQLDPGLADASFDNDQTVVLTPPSEPPRSSVPAGWPDLAAQHYTSYGPCTPDPGCESLTQDSASGALASSGVPLAMYDDEDWTLTPDNEKAGVCSYMNQFTQLAHANGLQAILAPDQNLATPGVITTYQGGESENWQAYLRLGLGTCAATTGTERYHIMSQPFQTHWCGGKGSACEGSESDFTNFVTQAALQAQAVKERIGLTAGFGTNPRYNTTPQALYQDTLDVARIVNHYWLNVTPANSAGIGVQYLEMLSGLQPLYLGRNATASPVFPASSAQVKTPLGPAGTDLTFISGQTLPAGTVIPAGDYKFEPWTDGQSGSAQVDVEVGYCNASDCTGKTPLIPPGTWSTRISAADTGVTSTATTQSATTLPAGGPYHVYLTVHVDSAAGFNLLYGAGNASANVAIPRPSSQHPSAHSSVLFAAPGDRLSTSIPRASSPAMLGLGKPGATSTFWSRTPLRAGQVIPAGSWEFQHWTDGHDGTATLNLQAGYCNDGCTSRVPLTDPTWRTTVAAGSRGADTPGGAYTTTSPAQLPSTGGPYHLYWTVTVDQAGPFNLLFDAAQAPTNVATPLLLPAHGPLGASPPGS